MAISNLHYLGIGIEPGSPTFDAVSAAIDQILCAGAGLRGSGSDTSDRIFKNCITSLQKHGIQIEHLSDKAQAIYWSLDSTK